MHVYPIFSASGNYYCVCREEKTSMFGWGVLKHGVPESVRFCFDDLPMYTFLVLTRPSLMERFIEDFTVYCKYK